MDKGIYIISDIHGCLAEMEAAISIIKNHNKSNKVVFVGDYIDRGPNSKGVIDRIIDLQNNDDHEWIALMGNHEDMFLHNHWGFMNNGGKETLMSYSYSGEWQNGTVDSEHEEWIKKLPLFHEENNVAIAHAGIPEGVLCKNADPEYLLWSRALRITEHGTYAHTVHGHTPMKNAVLTKDVSYIDTGCVFGNYLTVLYIPDTITPDYEKFETFKVKAN